MKLTSLMSEYFSDLKTSDILSEASTIPVELPIKAKEQSKWKFKENPERMVRIYKLQSESKFKYFIQDLLDLQDETKHHARITIQHPQIKIELWTHDISQVTETDLDWVEKADRIFNGYK